MNLPVEEALPALRAALRQSRSAVLVAPPGAGKTTRVPLALLDEEWCTGRIVLLEPRRLAARAAAARMSETLQERIGDTVGLRVRLETRVSNRTRIEVVTEGVFTRMILADPELSGVSLVVFDEFHERSLDADLGLALALDAQSSLRADLRLLPMSATLDGARVAALVEGTVVESRGRAFPVEIVHDPRRPDERIEDKTARAVREALATHPSSVLAFLPGRREIVRTAERLRDVPADVSVHPLYGALPPGAQDAAIRPAREGRKVVLATSIAESSLTIDGVDLVIDSGLSRRPVFDPATGLTRLATVRASRASADQRAGRAGRTAPGRAVRLWHEGQTAALEPFDPPEILAADLSALMLDLADWGVADPRDLRWLDAPPEPAIAEARKLLRRIECLDAQSRVTPHGRAVAARALPPRLAHMVLRASDPRTAARLALVTQERGLGGTDVDLAHRLERFGRERGGRADSVRRLADRIARGLDATGDEEPGACLSRAFPDRIAERRGPANGMRRFRMANGAGAEIEDTHPLAAAPWLVIVDLAGQAGRARILSAATLDRADLERIHGAASERRREPELKGGAARVREQMRLGSIVLSETVVPATPAEAWPLLREAIRRDGLPLDGSARGLLARLRLVAPGRMDEASLVASLDDWLRPFAPGTVSLADLARALPDALLAHAGHDRLSLDAALPLRWTAPSGRAVEIDYREGPAIALRPQDVYGLDAHPQVAGRPVLLTLLSPAGRPVQTTADLPGFWRSSWKDVRTEMKGRYPKHTWPERPWEAEPRQGTRRR